MIIRFVLHQHRGISIRARLSKWRANQRIKLKLSFLEPNLWKIRTKRINKYLIPQNSQSLWWTARETWFLKPKRHLLQKELQEELGQVQESAASQDQTLLLLTEFINHSTMAPKGSSLIYKWMSQKKKANWAKKERLTHHRMAPTPFHYNTFSTTTTKPKSFQIRWSVAL